MARNYLFRHRLFFVSVFVAMRTFFDAFGRNKVFACAAACFTQFLKQNFQFFRRFDFHCSVIVKKFNQFGWKLAGISICNDQLLNTLFENFFQALFIDTVWQQYFIYNVALMAEFVEKNCVTTFWCVCRISQCTRVRHFYRICRREKKILSQWIQSTR